MDVYLLLLFAYRLLIPSNSLFWFWFFFFFLCTKFLVRIIPISHTAFTVRAFSSPSHSLSQMLPQLYLLCNLRSFVCVHFIFMLLLLLLLPSPLRLPSFFFSLVNYDVEKCLILCSLCRFMMANEFGSKEKKNTQTYTHTAVCRLRKTYNEIYFRYLIDIHTHTRSLQNCANYHRNKKRAEKRSNYDKSLKQFSDEIQFHMHTRKIINAAHNTIFAS